jgi:hypothetical protein
LRPDPEGAGTPWLIGFGRRRSVAEEGGGDRYLRKIGDEMGGSEYLTIKGEEGPRESSCEPWKRVGRGARRRGEGRDVARWAPTAAARLSTSRIIMAILVLPKGTEGDRVLPGSPT